MDRHVIAARLTQQQSHQIHSFETTFQKTV